MHRRRRRDRNERRRFTLSRLHSFRRFEHRPTLPVPDIRILTISVSRRIVDLDFSFRHLIFGYTDRLIYIYIYIMYVRTSYFRDACIHSADCKSDTNRNSNIRQNRTPQSIPSVTMAHDRTLLHRRLPHRRVSNIR